MGTVVPDDRLQRIDDPADPRMAPYRDIRERDMVLRDDAFVAEGTVVLRVLAGVHGGPCGFRVRSVLVLESRVDGVVDILSGLPEDVPIYVAARSVLDAIAGFAMHRGVLAIGAFAPPGGRDLIDGLPGSALVLVGQAISNHDNMGALFRNAAVFGADAALFDARSCHPLYRKAIRVSVGGVFRVPFSVSGSIEEIVDRLDSAGFELWGLAPRGEIPIEAIRPGRRVALLAGTEGTGLPEALMQRIRTARIAQAPGMDSLNVATASAIALHAIAHAMGRLS